MFDQDSMTIRPVMPGRNGTTGSRLLETSAGVLEIAVSGEGLGRPLVLVTHGMGNWESLAELGSHVLDAQPGRCIIAWSRPGRGRSPDSGDIGMMDPLTHEAGIVLPALLTALGVDRADFVGHGDGATVALMFAALFPDRVGRVAAIAPHAFVDLHLAIAIEGLPELDASAGLSERLCACHDDAEAAYRAWISVLRAHVAQGWSTLELLTGVTAPLLLIQGMDDEYSSHAQLSAIAAAVSGPVDWVLLRDQGHFPQHDSPEHVFGLVERHLAVGIGRRRAAVAR